MDQKGNAKDFNKAFDKVPLGKLIQRLKSTRSRNHLMQNWLVKRQTVMFECCSGNRKPVTNSVLQKLIVFVTYIDNSDTNIGGLHVR